MNAPSEISPLSSASAALLTLTAVYLHLLHIRKCHEFSRQDVAAAAAWENEGGRIDSSEGGRIDLP
jgi:hypothetical protein